MLYGFDIGGTKIAFSVYDQALNCVAATQIATPVDYTVFLKAIHDSVKNADQRFACTGKIGIGVPGAISDTDNRVFCANVAALNGEDLLTDLSALLRRDIKLENDANCFLLSECYAGAADHCTSALGVTLGTGVGGAVFINGAIHRGVNAFAGEIGHYPLPATALLKFPDLPHFKCGCGRAMCLETYISGTGLANLYHYYAQQTLLSLEIIERFRTGEPIACKVVDIYLELLAIGLATSIMVLDPQVLVFGGGLSRFSDIYDALEKRLPNYLLKGVQLPKISKASFGETGGVRGAALLNYPPLCL